MLHLLGLVLHPLRLRMCLVTGRRDRCQIGLQLNLLGLRSNQQCLRDTGLVLLNSKIQKLCDRGGVLDLLSMPGNCASPWLQRNRPPKLSGFSMAVHSWLQSLANERGMDADLSALRGSPQPLDLLQCRVLRSGGRQQAVMQLRVLRLNKGERLIMRLRHC